MKKILMGFMLTSLIACKGGGGGGSAGHPIKTLPVFGIYELCKDVPEYDYSFVSRVLIDTHQITRLSIFYSGSGCQSGQEEFSSRKIYAYEQVAEMHQLFLISASATSLSAADLAYSNDVAYCGITDWLLNVPRDVLDRDCAGYVAELGDTFEIALSWQGNSMQLVADEVYTYQRRLAWDLTPQGLALTNGNYGYFRGNFGLFLHLNNGSYGLSYYDTATGKSYIEYGTYTSGGNRARFKMQGTLPDCGYENLTADYMFNLNSSGLAMEDEEGEKILLEKVSMSNSQFKEAILPVSFSSGCI
jgi:hypothetical protein